MVREGLIARPTCFCELCGSQELLKEAKRWRQQDRPVKGYVHVGEFDPSEDLDDIRIPIVFGWTDGMTLQLTGPECGKVGRIVASCLEQHRIPYEWDGCPGKPILINLDDILDTVQEPAPGVH
jgi:hypothetical protein